MEIIKRILIAIYGAQFNPQITLKALSYLVMVASRTCPMI